MTFGYDSSFVLALSRMRVDDFAIELFTRLRLERLGAQEVSRPVIFICHSLGGIVFKDAIVEASLQGTMYEGILKNTAGVVFMGTPHRASRTASPARNLTRIVNVLTVGATFKTHLLKTLEVSSSESDAISRRATHLMKNFPIVSFYEQKPLGATLVSTCGTGCAMETDIFPDRRAIFCNIGTS
jgi:protein SERAC1